MVSKRNVLSQKTKYTCKVQKYSIKKLSVGVASVLVGTALYLGNSVSAAEVTYTEVNSNNAALIEESSTVSEGATVENGSAASSEVVPTEVAAPSTVSEGATVENGPAASSGVAPTEVEEPSEEVTAEKVNSELNRAADGDFEGSIVSNKSKWTMKPWGVSTIVTEGNNTFGKINGETKDEYILQKIPTTPGKNI